MQVWPLSCSGCKPSPGAGEGPSGAPGSHAVSCLHVKEGHWLQAPPSTSWWLPFIPVNLDRNKWPHVFLLPWRMVFKKWKLSPFEEDPSLRARQEETPH